MTESTPEEIEAFHTKIAEDWAEHQAMLDDPEQGHTFEFVVRVRGSSKVVGDPVHTDAPGFMGDPWVVRARGWSLKAALERASQVPFHIMARDNYDEDEEREPIAVLCKHEGVVKILQARFACANGEDEPLYPGDRVHTVATIGAIMVGGVATRASDDEAWVERAHA